MNNLYKQMLREMQEKNIFEQSKKFAFEYADEVMDRGVYPESEAISNLERFNEDLPVDGSDAPDVLDLLHTFGSPATVAQTGGRYFGMVNGGVLPIGLAAKWLNDFWDQNTPLYVTSPVVSKLEDVVEKWLKEIFGLPSYTSAGFVSGTSMAILCGLGAARYRIYDKLGWNINEKGLAGAPKIRVVAGKQAHGTVIKAIALLGLGKNSIEWVDIDDQGRMLVESLPQLDESTILILQAGNVNSGAFDNFKVINQIAKRAGAWIHIDGAFGLWAAGCQKLKHNTDGIELADSYSVDGHKTLNTPYDCGIVLCKDKDALIASLQATGSYIIYGSQRDGMLYTPEMSRRARIVELWATLKYLGKTGVNELVYSLHERAEQFREELESNGFNILNDVVFNQVLVACSSDEETVAVLTAVQRERICWVGGAEWLGKKVIRISVCSWATTENDVSESVRSFVHAKNLIDKK